MWSFLVVVALLTTSGAAPKVTVTQLDGTWFSGTLESWTDEQVVVATQDGQRRFAVSEMFSLKLSREPSSAAAPQVVELIDGSILPSAHYRAAATAKFALQHSAPSAMELMEVPIESIRAVRLQPLEADALRQWDEIRARQMPGDVLVVAKQNGQSLDYLEGVVGDITDDEVTFTLDGKSIRVPRSKVAGVIYYRATQSSDQPPPCTVHGRFGMRASASLVRVIGEYLHFTTSEGVDVTWPVDDLLTADFSAGKVVFLSDLEPASDRWTPWVAFPTGTSLATDYGRTRRNESFVGGQLMLTFPDGMPATAEVPGAMSTATGRERTFDKGLAIRSRTELVYRLPSGFTRFMAVSGIEPSTSASGDVRLLMDGDGRQLLDTRVVGNEPPLPIDLKIDGIKRLTIVVDYGANLDMGDWLNLCNARIVK